MSFPQKYFAYIESVLASCIDFSLSILIINNFQVCKFDNLPVSLQDTLQVRELNQSSGKLQS